MSFTTQKKTTKLSEKKKYSDKIIFRFLSDKIKKFSNIFL